MLEPRPRITSAGPPEIAFQGRVALEDADGIVGAEHDHCGAETERPCARDRSEHDVAGGHLESSVWCSPMPKKSIADLVGEHALLDHAADRVRVRSAAVRVRRVSGHRRCRGRARAGTAPSRRSEWVRGLRWSLGLRFAMAPGADWGASNGEVTSILLALFPWRRRPRLGRPQGAKRARRATRPSSGLSNGWEGAGAG